MIAQLQYYGLRTLWSSMGIGTMTLVIIPENFWLKVFVFLCGIITLLISILLGGFIKHILNHSQDRETLFKILEKYRTKDLCDERSDFMKESLERIENKLGCKNEST